MKKAESGYTVMELFVLLGFLLTLVIGIGSIYVTGSLIASGVKAATHSCGTEYGIEPIVSGDWFCPDE